ncbi:arsinothricin resistance N-acetyltransferase ArsN1 family B [Undibacterium sp. Ren11W]|uniref:arsinothricin resistance N-acetyltransferase ArsN1 family B n=1 Tax=Undibacterium sp. Ren11W TaxID=3413045 RepID=UPI003BF3290F
MTIIRPVKTADAEAICNIYNYYVENTTISFEEAEVAASEMSQRIIRFSETLPWLVIENDGIVVGYAYATKWRERSAYRFSVEVSVYLSPLALGRGCGTSLYEYLFDDLGKLGVHAVIAGIALPNEKSIKLHEKMGFRKVAHFSEVGFKNNQWVDVTYWQKLL